MGICLFVISKAVPNSGKNTGMKGLESQESETFPFEVLYWKDMIFLDMPNIAMVDIL